MPVRKGQNPIMTEKKIYKACIYGAGAIGGWLGVGLAQAGCQVSVVARGASPANALFVALAQRSGQAPAWNFHKYLIGRDGQTVISFASAVDPKDPVFIKDLGKLLKAK